MCVPLQATVDLLLKMLDAVPNCDAGAYMSHKPTTSERGAGVLPRVLARHPAAAEIIGSCV